MSDQIYDRELTRNEDKWTTGLENRPLFCGNAIEIVEEENSHWTAYEEGGQYHHCLRDRRNSV